MKKSESIQNLAAALAAFQGDCPKVDLDREVSVRMKTGGQYKFKYATFAGIISTVRPVMKKHKLAFSQLIGDGGKVTTILMHESGEYISSEFQISPKSGSPQEIGSAISYAKRYALAAILGIAADDDDDANIAEQNQYEVKSKPKNGSKQQTYTLGMFRKHREGYIGKMNEGKTASQLVEALHKRGFIVPAEVTKAFEELQVELLQNA